MGDATPRPWRVSDADLTCVLGSSGKLNNEWALKFAADLRDARQQIEALTREVEQLKLDCFVAASDRDALRARLAALQSAEGCDVEAALAAYAESTMTVPVPENSAAVDMSAALAAGCAPLRVKYEALVDAARGLSHGFDWNNGRHAKRHGYRQKLLDALAALDGDKP